MTNLQQLVHWCLHIRILKKNSVIVKDKLTYQQISHNYERKKVKRPQIKPLFLDPKYISD